MSTLQAVAPIPAFIARSMLWLPRRDDVAVVALAFEGIGFTFWACSSYAHRVHGIMRFGGCETPTTQLNTKV
jgi:hypothetical protein